MAYEIKYRSDNEMKDSGIEWLGKIPKEWEVTSLGKVATIQTGNTPSMQSTKDYYENGNVLWVKPDNLSEFEIITDTQEKINKYGISKAKKVPPFTPLVCCIGSIGKFGYSDRTVTYNQQINSIEFNCKKIFWKYGLYFISSQKDQHWYYSNGNVVQILNAQGQKKIKLPLVSLQDQQKIANFLDIKTAEFDSIISKKEQLIEKLEEAKKSLISEVVTGKVKIVDGELVDRKPEEMKDSGVEWLGMIPKDWEVKRLKYLVNLKSKKTVPKNDEKYIGLENIESKTGKYLESNEEEFIAEGTSNIFNKNDVLFGKLRPYLSKCIVADFDGVCSSEILVFEPREIIPQLLKYYILNDDFIDLVNSSTYGAKMPRASWDFIGNTYMPYFSLLHQKTIIQYLDNASNKMDSIITKTKKQIKKLKEAKQSLISEAVTGKIDLRDWEIIETGGR
jgi:type I restriction enzyme S subunit